MTTESLTTNPGTVEPCAADAGTSGSAVTVDVHLDQSAWATHLAEETLVGLRDDPPWIPPVWFYDELGSDLFDRITRLPEYYPTEAERSILAERAAEIATITGAVTLAELGSGTSDKTALLLDALAHGGTLATFAPFDCSEEILRNSAETISEQRPGLAVHAVVGDFHEHLEGVPTEGICLLAFLGSTIGNLDPAQRKGFLAEVSTTLDADDWFLLGTDLVKPTERLLPAYDDAEGITAAFNLNALRVMNDELGGDFDPAGFSHRAAWDADNSRVEMHLVAESDQSIHLGALRGLDLTLCAGDHIRTEISTKFTPDQVRAELAAAGLATEAAWTDPAGDFLLTLARPS